VQPVVVSGYNADDISSTVALIVDRLLENSGEDVERIQRRILADIDELRSDPRLVELLRSSVAGNVETVLTVIRYGIDLDRVEPPTAALEYARRAAQHGIALSALIRAYRLGQQQMLERILREVRETELDPDLRLSVYERISSTSFAYIDWISQQVSDTYDTERERWLEHRNNIRAVRVREILDSDEPIDIDTASAALGYPLRGRHLALVLWMTRSDLPGGELLRLERFARAVAEAFQLRNTPLFVAEDTVSGWAWLAINHVVTEPVRTIRELAETADNGVHVALGTVDDGLEGFRRSHRRARDARKVAAASAIPPRITAADDYGISVSALLTENLADTRRWVLDTLGPLASDTANDARLRETLLVFLHVGSSYTAAAERLLLHPNSVRYRVNRAVERRARPIGEDRLEVELALLACRHFQQAVLQPAD
jgi:DNA-binding PucR family transcriptional regulator